MGQLLHGSARTNQAIRSSIQRSQEGRQTLAKRHNIASKILDKWIKINTVTDILAGPKPASTMLTAEEKAVAGAFRQHKLLPLDDCLYALQGTIPRLSRSALHRCFQRHSVSRLPLSEDGQSAPKKKFKDYSIGYLHIDFAKVHTEEGRQYLFVVIDRTSKAALIRVITFDNQQFKSHSNYLL
jgi:hypothetical protein